MAGRVPQLDVLRGIAVLLVLVHHSPGGEGALLKAGWTGVDLFFVLSGFLVSGLLFKEHLRSGRIRPGRFYVRRGLKIYPNFYTMLAVTSAALAWAHVPVEPRSVLHEAVFLQNYLPAAWWGREHAWSLAIEEHFYLLLPPVLMLVLRSRRFRRAPVRGAAALTAALGATLLAVRWAMVRSGAGAVDVLFLTHTRLDSLACGVALSVLWHFAPARVATIRRLRWILLLTGLLLTAPCYLLSNEHPFILTLGLTLNYVGYAMVLAAVLTLPTMLPRPLGPALAFVGFYSYSIYLWHLPLLAIVRNALGDRAPGVALFYAGSILAGVMMARLVELPALRLRERWLPGPPAR
jgi:peptidoglycan/LPS O-acetylase OafA/YrhL